MRASCVVLTPQVSFNFLEHLEVVWVIFLIKNGFKALLTGEI